MSRSSVIIRCSTSDLLKAMAISKSAFSCNSALRSRSRSSRTLSDDAHAIWSSSLSLALVLEDDDVVDDDRAFKLKLGAPLFREPENCKSSPQIDADVLLVVDPLKGSIRLFHAESQPNELSKSIFAFEGALNGANGSFSIANGSRLSDTFLRMPFVEGAENGSSLVDAKGSANPTSLNGSSVNSNSAYRCCCGCCTLVILAGAVEVPQASKASPAEGLINWTIEKGGKIINQTE